MDGGISLDALRNVPNVEKLTDMVGAFGLTPGWIPRRKPILSPAPRTEFKTMHWQYATAKAAMDGAGKVIGTDLAERRNLVMRNPIPDNEVATLRTLVCAYQTILPGEVARTHRHAPHAFRVILDSRGAWSCVNGDKHPMDTGDIVLTPGWCWHGHGHDGSDQAYWFDGLDVPLTHLLEPMFFEDWPAGGLEPIKRTTPDSPFRFTDAFIRKSLDEAKEDHEGHYGKRIVLDTHTMPTMGIWVHRWKPGWQSRPYRTTSNQVFLVMQGSGRSTVGGQTIEWRFGDTFAAPCWHDIRHEAADEAQVMCMTDEPLLRFAKYHRRQALD